MEGWLPVIAGVVGLVAGILLVFLLRRPSAPAPLDLSPLQQNLAVVQEAIQAQRQQVSDLLYTLHELATRTGQLETRTQTTESQTLALQQTMSHGHQLLQQ